MVLAVGAVNAKIRQAFSSFGSSYGVVPMAYDTVISIWRAILYYTPAVPVLLFTVVGFISSVLHLKKFCHILLFTIAAACLGFAAAVLLGAVPALLVAATYSSVPSQMSPVEAVVIGNIQGVLIGILNLGFFHRIL